jgi:hypothetical protein
MGVNRRVKWWMTIAVPLTAESHARARNLDQPSRTGCREAILKRCRVLLLMAFVFSCFVSTVTLGQTPLLRQLAKEDTDSRTGKSVERTDAERIKIVLELIAKGTLKGAEDQFDAALVLQHTGMDFCGKRLVSKSADNYLIAHYLFISAYEGGYKDALYLIAASIDRYLSMTEGYQKFSLPFAETP